MTNGDIADMLMRFVKGEVTEWEFDDFISSRQEGVLDKYRLELSQIRESYPPDEDGAFSSIEGKIRIKEIADAIRCLKL